jgi:hypothetical protein
MISVNFRGGQKDVNPGSVAGRFHGSSGGIDVRGSTPSKTGNDWATYLSCNSFDGFIIAVADNGEPGLNYVDIEPLQLPGDL